MRQLDAGEVKKLPPQTPTAFVPQELHRALKDSTGTINRNAWETGLALAMKDALRSGDLYLPQSKHHVSFWDLTLKEPRWQEVRETAYRTLHQPQPQEVQAVLTREFQAALRQTQEHFSGDDFATIEDGRLKLKRDDKVALPSAVTTLQKVIDTRLPSIRIEQLLT